MQSIRRFQPRQDGGDLGKFLQQMKACLFDDVPPEACLVPLKDRPGRNGQVVKTLTVTGVDRIMQLLDPVKYGQTKSKWSRASFRLLLMLLR